MHLSLAHKESGCAIRAAKKLNEAATSLCGALIFASDLSMVAARQLRRLAALKSESIFTGSRGGVMAAKHSLILFKSILFGALP